MDLPSYFLPQPEYVIDADQRAAFDRQCQLTDKQGFIDYQLTYPKWQFLTYMCESRDVVLHGSQNRDIEVVEPRQAHDKRAYSNQNAIYATTDGIWVIYFAIVDRRGYPGLSLFNSCFQIKISEQQMSEPYYFFSISSFAKEQKAWCDGAVYILPRNRFSREPVQHIQGAEVVFPHWISTSAAKPVAKLLVCPQDFPFVEQIHGHNDQKLVELYRLHPEAFPIEALES